MTAILFIAAFSIAMALLLFWLLDEKDVELSPWRVVGAVLTVSAVAVWLNVSLARTVVIPFRVLVLAYVTFTGVAMALAFLGGWDRIRATIIAWITFFIALAAISSKFVIEW
jgi:hypothetical protein